MLLNPRPVRQKKEDWVKLLEKQGVTVSSDISEEALQDQYVKYFLVLPSLEEKCVALVEQTIAYVQGAQNFDRILLQCAKNGKGWKSCVRPEYLKLLQVQKSEVFSLLLTHCVCQKWCKGDFEKAVEESLKFI